MAKKPTEKRKEIATPALVVLQWLSYVLWGLSIAALTSVVALVVGYNTDSLGWVDESSVFYAFAALVILLPLAVVLDVVFSRYENPQKNVATSVVMVVHVVLYTLISVGALITLLFTAITQLTSVSADGDPVTIVSSALVALLVAGLVFRIARPTQWKLVRMVFRVDMIVIALVAAGFAIAGPITYSVSTREDRAVRDSAQFISNTISTYVSQQGNVLPENLDTALNDSETYYGDDALKTTSQRVISEGKITYKPYTQASEIVDMNNQTTTTYFYELCATYTQALRSNNPSGPIYGPVGSVSSSEVGYRDFLDTDSVQAGTTCYKLKAYSYK